MFWLFFMVVAATLGAVIAAGVLAPSRGFALRVVGVILALAILVVLTVLLWKQAILALAIAAVCSLAIGVMFQKVAPAKAIEGAIAAFVLIFVFSWLALQMAGPLLFDRESDLSRWLHQIRLECGPSGRHAVTGPNFLVALGGASLLAACCLDGWMRATAVFAGALLMFFFSPALLENSNFFGQMFYGHDPVFNLAFLCVFVIGFAVVVRLLRTPRRHCNSATPKTHNPGP